jgi:hypothetical protein
VTSTDVARPAYGRSPGAASSIAECEDGFGLLLLLIWQRPCSSSLASLDPQTWQTLYHTTDQHTQLKPMGGH